MDSVTPPPDDEDVCMSSENGAPTAELPRRLASRFERKSNNHHRSSANSSRRSSISSRHSGHSGLSCHGGPYSTHIAQHLRRASIIESRKARLADRAAHAEQVRLRAAAARTAQKASYNEEKALAAQAAREKLLAEVAARCEEEVRRVKKVAEETKERKAAEVARMKAEMTEKYAEATRRRLLYQQNIRRARTSSLADVEEKKVHPSTLRRINHNTAAKIIQRAWRAHQRRKTINTYLSLGLTPEARGKPTFEQLSQLISESQTMAATGSMLKMFNLLEMSSDETAEKGAVRMFLSAYLVSTHPVQAFSHGGQEPQEQNLIGKAQNLLQHFHLALQAKKLSTSRLPVVAEHDERLLFLYNDYGSSFHTWKSQDVEILIDVMINSFVNLDLILQATKHDHRGHVAEDYLQAVKQEQIKLLARLKRLAGPEAALSRVRAAVRQARKERAARIRKEEGSSNVPRSTNTGSREVTTSAGAPITPPSTPKPPKSVRDAQASSYVTKLGQTMTVLPSNREISHEMQINGGYQVQQQPWTDARKEFMTKLRTSMRTTMERGGSQATASWTHAMAVLVREKLMNLVSPRHPLYERIDGFLDPEFIAQQSRQGVFEYSSFFDTIGGLISQVCSPGRDEAVQRFLSDSTSDVIDRLFNLIDIIDLMTLDHINFQFRLAAPSVIEHGHEHEQTMFEKDLQAGVISLDRCRSWWSAAQTSMPTSTANGNATYTRALVDLVLGNVHMSLSDLPETLQLDSKRLLGLRAQALQLVASASILLTTKIRLRRNREAMWTSDAARLKSLDLLTTDARRIVALIESSHMMPDSIRDGLLNFVERVLPTAVAAAENLRLAEQEDERTLQNPSPDGPSAATTRSHRTDDVFTEQVSTFVLKSLREHVFSRLAASSTAERVRTNTNAAEVLARAGMPEFVGDVAGIVDLLERIKTVDLRAHGRWYDEIATHPSTPSTTSRLQ